MLRVVVLVSGGGTNLQAILDAQKQGRITNAAVTAVISNNADAYALERAKNFGVEAVCVSPDSYENRELYHEALVKTVQSYRADLVVLAGCMVVMPKAMIDAYPNRIVNVHPALIPAFSGTGCYGLLVHEKALERGVKVTFFVIGRQAQEKVTGATVHFVDEGTDTGPIILQKAVEVLPEDTPQTLQRRVMEEAEWQLLPRAIDLIANGKVTVEQNKVVIKE